MKLSCLRGVCQSAVSSAHTSVTLSQSCGWSILLSISQLDQFLRIYFYVLFGVCTCYMCWGPWRLVTCPGTSIVHGCGFWNQTQILWKGNRHSKPPGHLPRQHLILISYFYRRFWDVHCNKASAFWKINVGLALLWELLQSFDTEKLSEDALVLCDVGSGSFPSAEAS